MSAAGCFLGVIGGSAVGWATPGADGAPAVVELLIDGKSIEAAVAKRPPPTAAELATILPVGEAPLATGPASGWFSLKVPIERRTGRPLALEIRVRDGQVLGRGEFRLFGGLKAKFVTIQDAVVQGYIANPYGGDAPTALDVRLDGSVIGEAEIEPPGEDGRRRFRFPMPPELRDGAAHEVGVCWSGTEIGLPGSPVSWTAPRPFTRQMLRDRETAAGTLRSRPDYHLPAMERFGITAMLDDQSLRRAAPEAVAEHTTRLWKILADPSPSAGAARLNIILTAGRFSDAEASIALGQLLEIDGAASIGVLLPSDEAVRFASDDQRDGAAGGLAPPFAAATLAGRLARLPPDDLVVFVPAHTVLTDAFLSTLRAVIAGQAPGTVGACAKAAVVGEGLLLASGLTEGWISSREAVGVLQADALALRMQLHRFEFEEVRFDEMALLADMAQPGGVTLHASMATGGCVADALLVLGDAELAGLTGLASQRAVAVAGQAVDAPAGWTVLAEAGAQALDQAYPLARALAGDADILVLDGSVAAPSADVLSACRAVVTAPHGAVLRHIAGVSPPKNVGDLIAATEAALAAAPFGAFFPSTARTL